MEEEAEGVWEPESMEDIRRKGPSKSTEETSYELTESASASTGPTWVCTRSSAHVLQLSG